MALPTFLCIGATKAGTTWLHAQLSVRPDVCMPVVKELHYFSAVHVPGHRHWASQTVDKAFRRELRHARNDSKSGDGDRSRVRHLKAVMAHEMFSEAWYRECFERPDRRGAAVTGEITPAYAELTDAGIAHVGQLLPQVRIIHLLRHPLDRALSHLRMAAHRRDTEATAAGLLDLINDSPQLISRGQYEEQIPRWQAHVPAERRLLLPFGLLKRDPVGLLRQVEAFIGVKAFEAYPMSEPVNTTRRIDIPPEVTAELERRVQPTVDFLRQTFGEDFLEQTR